ITGGSNPTSTESSDLGIGNLRTPGATNPGAIPSPNSIGYSRDVRMTWSGPMSSSIYTRGSILTASNSTRLSPVGRTDTISASWTTRVRLPIYTTVGALGSFVIGTSGGMAARVTVRPLIVAGIGGLAVPSGLRIITRSEERRVG